MNSQNQQERLSKLKSSLPSSFENHDDKFPDCDLIPIDLESSSEFDEKLASEDPSDVDWPSPSSEEINLPRGPGSHPENEPSVDSLAFYLSYHFYDDYWGIYIKPEGVQYLRKVLDPFFKSFSVRPVDQIKIAKDLLYHHESYHNKIDGFATTLQIVNFTDRVYIDHFTPEYKRSFNDPYGPLEETCANSFAREAVIKTLHNVSHSGDKKAYNAAFREQVNAWFATLPRGYAEASKTPTGWDKKIKGRLLNQYSDTLRPNSKKLSLDQSVWLGTSADNSYTADLIKQRVFWFIGHNSRYLPQKKSAKYPNLKKTRFIKNLKKHFPKKIIVKSGGKHSHIAIPPRTIPYTTKRDWVEDYLIKEICDALGINENYLKRLGVI